MSDKVVRFAGDAAEVTWDGRLCIHVAECGRAENDLFQGGRKPWCQPDLVTIDEVVEVVERCPTGALTYTVEGTAETNTVVIANNGPLYFRGELEIDGALADAPGLSTRAALCRCGQSKNKPCCDNSHESAGFVDRGAVGRKGSTLESEGGPLVVKRAKNGPLLVSGNLKIINSAGRVAWTGTKAALCRCGASGTKPFCDGAHNAAGFEAD
jgi:CDGSH-type Zn-finger protein